MGRRSRTLFPAAVATLVMSAAALPSPSARAAAPTAQDTAARAPATGPLDQPRVFLMTFGPGAEVWERFGHNAIWVHDPVRGTDSAYHYGLFDMSEEGFLVEFLQGRMAYSMGSADALLLMEAYRRRGRSATIQELRMSPEQIGELRTFLEWNMLPPNRVYRYDYFRDNCSTRIRDALDGAMGGALARALRARETPVTYRTEALALTAEDELLATGMDLGLGPLADQPLTHWELAFIPMRLRDDLRGLTVTLDGERLPLVVAERELPAVGAPDGELATPTGRIDVRVAWMLLLGLVIGGAVAGVGWLASRRTGGNAARAVARWILALAGSLWGLVGGVLGLILLGLWALTDHEFAHVNENLLQASPLALALVVLVPLAVVGGRGRAAAVYTAAALAALSALGLLIHPLPLTPQENLGTIGLALPIHLGLLAALRIQRRRPG